MTPLDVQVRTWHSGRISVPAFPEQSDPRLYCQKNPASSTYAARLPHDVSEGWCDEIFRRFEAASELVQ